jgi:predicted dehydrogenase
MKRSIKFGIFGLRRGATFYKNILANNADIVAVCDREESKLNAAREQLGSDVATYRNFDEFIEHKGLEAVFLCNNFNQHTDFAIRALEKNIHVLSECTSNSTMAEGVRLVRAAEKTNAVYMLSENYPYMKFNQEMSRIYKGGTLGKLLFAEGEYNHPLDPNDEATIKELRPYEKHWRNYLPRTYYITHSLGPLMYITGAVPTRVSAFPVYLPSESDPLMGLNVGDRAAIITCLNGDGSVFRVTGCAAFGAHENSYRICGTKGKVENLRDGSKRVLLNYNEWEAPDGVPARMCYEPVWKDKDKALIEAAGHGGGDFLVIRDFFDCIRENKKPFFDVYAATTMASVAILSHRSVLEGGKPYDIPDFRKEEDRIKYENDDLTPFWGADGSEPTLPCSSNPDHKVDPADLADYRRILNTEY